MNKIILVYVTIDTVEHARALACTLLEKKLVACINLLPGVESMYVWDGAVRQDHEVVMIAKTTLSCYEQLQLAIAEHHPYQVPCILKVEAETNTPFGDFVRRAVT